MTNKFCSAAVVSNSPNSQNGPSNSRQSNEPLFQLLTKTDYCISKSSASKGSNKPQNQTTNEPSNTRLLKPSVLVVSSQTAMAATCGQLIHSPQCVHGALMRTASSNFSCPVHGSQAHLCSSEARVLSRANKILMKKRYSSSSHLVRKYGWEKSIRNFKVLKQLLSGPSTQSNSVSLSMGKPLPIQRATRKQTPTVTHQFQQSLQQLMDTLSQANPFFVRCIKSNAEKMPNHFDDRLVLQQLRYTGMLETVRIRQSGYSVRLTFDEFIQHYRILLPKGLLSSKMDVQRFLVQMKLSPDMYQIGKTKVFMRESEKLILDERLHEEILRRIINLQRWVRTWICHQRFSAMRKAAIIIQTYFRRFIAQKRLRQLKMIAQYENRAANAIQKHWRAYQTRKWFTNLRKSIVRFQANCRSYLIRSQMNEIVEEHSKAREEAKAQLMQSKVNKTVSVVIRATPPVSKESNKQAASYSISLSPVDVSQMSGLTDENTLIIPIRKFSLIDNEVDNKEIDLDEGGDDDDDFENNDQVRLNRKRNIPIRKTSFKRKANKSLSDDKLLTSTTSLESPSSFETTTISSTTSSTNLIDTQQHRQLTKLFSDSNVCSTSTSSFILSSGYVTNSESASSIQKLDEHNISSDLSNFLSSNNNFGGVHCLDIANAQDLESMNRLSILDNGRTMTIDELQQASIGPIQKAKATLRNMMTGKSTSNQEVIKRQLKQSTSAKTEIETDHILSSNLHNCNNCTNLMNNKSLSNNDLGLGCSGGGGGVLTTTFSPASFFSSSHLDIQKSQKQQYDPYFTQNAVITKSKSQDEKFTLLSRHFIKEENNFKLGEICAICENSILSSSNQPQTHLKCTECKQLFHRKCIHLSTDIPCIKEGSNFSNTSTVLNTLNPLRPPRSKGKKTKNYDKLAKENQEFSRTSLMASGVDINHQTQLPATKSVRVKQFTDPHDVLITDLDELQRMDKFISKKMREMDDSKKKAKESMVDIVFKRALKEFKANLISTYSVGNQDGYFRLTYKDLIDHFEQILLKVCQIEKTYKSFPVIIGINAFRGYMDELRNMHNMKTRDSENKLNNYNLKKANKRKQNKKVRRNKKEEEVHSAYGHEFYLSTANIYTVCEVCDSYMWLMEKIWVCRRCKLTCHKKCLEKIKVPACGENNKSSNKVVFGASLALLVNDECRIPLVVEQLITKIELKGLYTEGIYRKSARITSIDELKQFFDSHQQEIDLDHYSVHVLAGCLKLFFREMPEPLMTYELYDDFLWATTITDTTERIQIIFNHISKLPKQNYDLLERLTFHLARVAQQESTNRMNANSLAIVFAPCILRTNKIMQMQDKLNDISKQTICIESIISERMRQISDTLNDIDILDTACHTASSRLSSIRHSKLNLNRDSNVLIRTSSTIDDEEALLAQRINELITEKNHLTNILPTFRIASTCSDEDM